MSGKRERVMCVERDCNFREGDCMTIIRLTMCSFTLVVCELFWWWLLSSV